MNEKLYEIAWKILNGHCVKDIEQHKIEQLATKIVDVLDYYIKKGHLCHHGNNKKIIKPK